MRSERLCMRDFDDLAEWHVEVPTFDSRCTGVPDKLDPLSNIPRTVDAR